MVSSMPSFYPLPLSAGLLCGTSFSEAASLNPKSSPSCIPWHPHHPVELAAAQVELAQVELVRELVVLKELAALVAMVLAALVEVVLAALVEVVLAALVEMVLGAPALVEMVLGCWQSTILCWS